MKIFTGFLLVLGLLTCHRDSSGKAKEPDFNCFAQDVPEGVELVCDGVPHLIKNGKDGAQGQSGRNGAPGPKGDPGPPGDSGQTIKEVKICHENWEGVPAYSIDYLVFTYANDIREAVASVETDKGEIFTNSAIWIKADSRFNEAPVDIGGFIFTSTSTGALVLYRANGRTSDMTCHSRLSRKSSVRDASNYQLYTF